MIANPAIPKATTARPHPKNTMNVVCETFLARVNPAASIAMPAGMSSTRQLARNCMRTTGSSEELGRGVVTSAARAVGPGRTPISVPARATMPNIFGFEAWLNHIPASIPSVQVRHTHAERELVFDAVVDVLVRVVPAEFGTNLEVIYWLVVQCHGR